MSWVSRKVNRVAGSRGIYEPAAITGGNTLRPGRSEWFFTVSNMDVLSVPACNLRVGLAGFVAVWKAAGEAVRDSIQGDTYTPVPALGVLQTCRWLGCSRDVSDEGSWEVVMSPVTGVREIAGPTRIELELDVLEEAMGRIDRGETMPPKMAHLTDLPEMTTGIVSTFLWAWLRDGDPPLPITVTEW